MKKIMLVSILLILSNGLFAYSQDEKQKNQANHLSVVLQSSHNFKFSVCTLETTSQKKYSIYCNGEQVKLDTEELKIKANIIGSMVVSHLLAVFHKNGFELKSSHSYTPTLTLEGELANKSTVYTFFKRL